MQVSRCLKIRHFFCTTNAEINGNIECVENMTKIIFDVKFDDGKCIVFKMLGTTNLNFEFSLFIYFF